MTFGGLRLRARGDVLVCLTGAPAPADADGRAVPHTAPFTLRDGQVLSLRMPPSGLRTYVSFRGGLAVLPGPRRDWFADPQALATTEWSVSERSDRKGIRFLGEPLARHTERRDAELPSEGMVRGAIQVPPNGQPVLFLNDHPVTGGYPVIGVVRSAHIDRAAQLQPGQKVRFRWESST